MERKIPLPRSQKPRAIDSGSICFDCELHSKCKHNCMAGAGMRGSMMLVGQKPEGGDIAAKTPFKGINGKKMDFLFEKAGIVRDSIFLTHAVKCDTSKKPTKKHLAACRMHLLEEIRWVKPKVIVTMGTEALQQVCPWAGSADDWRGFPIPIRNKTTGQLIAWCVPTLSIKQALNDPTSDPILVRDLKLAKKILKETWTPPPLDIKVKTIKTIADLKQLTEKLCNADSFAFDLETEGFKFLRNRILCASFSIDGREGFVVPIDKEFRNSQGVETNWRGTDRDVVLSELKKIFLSKAKKSAHNGKFDIKWLKTYGIGVRNFDFDTMLAHHLVDSEKPHDLTFVAQWYGIIHEKYDKALEIEKKKVGNNYAKIDCDTLYYYAGIDAAVTQAVRPLLEEELVRTQTRSVFDKISMRLVPVLADMEYGGVRINLVEMNKIIEATDEGIIKYTQKICEILGVDEFKPNATKPIKDFFQKKRVRLTKTTASGAFSVDVEVLKGLRGHPKVGDLCKAVLKLRELSKLKTTYLDGNGKRDTRTGELKGMRNKLDANHYLHTSFNIHGTYTGRLSSSGPNLQNIPKKHGIRQLFIPDSETDIFMDVDYKQLEVRVAAAVSKDLTLIKEIRAGVDMHSRNAATFLMRVPEEDFIAVINDEDHPDHKLYKEKRRAAKAVTFGVLYGSTAHGVAARENIPLEDCELFIKKFFQKYSRLAQWIKSQHDKVYNTHKVVSPTGRVIKFHDLEWAMSRYCSDFERKKRFAEVMRISVNMPIQGYGSDIFQTKCIALHTFMRKRGLKSKFKLSIHDGFVINLKADEKELMKVAVPKIMNTVLNKGTKYEVPIEVDMDFFDKWEGEKLAA